MRLPQRTVSAGMIVALMVLGIVIVVIVGWKSFRGGGAKTVSTTALVF